MDDGGLTRRICEEVVDDVESQPTTGTNMNNPCCACDEARYEVSLLISFPCNRCLISFSFSYYFQLTFEGVWSRNLHPRYFPARGWETRFCELVGAAHSSDYRFWESGVLASEAVKQYAEHCTSRLLEREFSLNFRVSPLPATKFHNLLTDPLHFFRIKRYVQSSKHAVLHFPILTAKRWHQCVWIHCITWFLLPQRLSRRQIGLWV